MKSFLRDLKVIKSNAKNLDRFDSSSILNLQQHLRSFAVPLALAFLGNNLAIFLLPPQAALANQLPTTNDLVAPSQSNPGGTTSIQVPTLSGNDLEDGALGTGRNFKIVTLPTNGKLYYSGTQITTPNYTIVNYSPALLTFDPDNGAVIGSFTYAAIDSTNAEDPTPATVTMPFTATPLITKTTSTPSVAAGGAATYTIKVTNPSNSTLSNVSVVDTLPSGFTYETNIGVPVLQNAASRSSIVNPTPGNTNPTWGSFNLPPNASITITFTANTDTNQTTGIYQNPVTVTYTDATGNQTASYNPSSSIAEDVTVTAAPAPPPAPLPAPVRSPAGICAVPGKDGPNSVSGIINTYYPSTVAQLSAGAQSVQLEASAGSTTSISPGDLLMIIQTQDAAIDSSDTAAYGSGSASNDGRGQTSMGSSGLYEYVVATNAVPASGGTLTFKGAANGGTGGTINTYYTSAPTASQGQRRFQVVRVPQYSNLTLGSTVTALEWNGQVGGIVAADVVGQLNFNGRTIDGVSRGFRGGYSEKSSSGTSLLRYRDTSSMIIGAGKGEGTAGTPRFVWNGSIAVDNGIQGYPNGDYGRGAPANAGGGGNFHNAGGGGGGNGGIGGKGGIPWQGSAGALDSGGRGGALSSLFTPDPSRLFLGGGGGGGDANNATTGVRGGVGGGLVILRAGTMAGSGSINVTGDAGDVGAFGSAPDGAGGGGAGGTVLVATRQNSLSANLSILASGGGGGNTLNDGGNEHGPGAGGGGGVLLHNVPGVSLVPTVLGGANGRAAGGTGSAHGATPGADGQVVPITNDPFATVNDEGCLPKLTVWKATTTPQITQGGLATYKITVSNEPGRTAATGVSIQDALPTGFTYESTTAIVLGTGVTRTTSTDPTVGSAIATWGSFDIPSGQKIEITFKALANGSISPGTYQNPVVASYLDPKRVNPTDTTSSQYNEVTNSGEDVTVVAPMVNNPNVLLVKRITAINGLSQNPNDNTPLNLFVDDTTSTKAADDNNSKWVTGYLQGAIDGGKVKPGDEIEYTIYFLSAGNAPVKKLSFCDLVPGNTTFSPNGFGFGQGIQLAIGSLLTTLTNVPDNDKGEFFVPNATPSATCSNTNTNGAVVVNVVQGTEQLSNAVSSGTPGDSYGFVRFKAKAK